MSSYCAFPVGDNPRALILVLHEIFGVNDYMCSVVDELASMGFVSTCPCLFERPRTFEYGQVDVALNAFNRRDPNALVESCKTAVGEIVNSGRLQDGLSLGILGFCAGATLGLHLVSSKFADSFVGFYPAFSSCPALTFEVPACPTLILMGDKDELMTTEEEINLSGFISKAPPPSGIVKFSGASHAFHCKNRSSYSPLAASAAWELSIDHFTSTLVSKKF